MIPRYYVVAERDHELQNPISREKLLLLAERIGIGTETSVLDVGSGRGGPAILFAAETGCRVRGIEVSPDFHAAAVERAAAAGVSDRVAFELGDASHAVLEREAYDVAMCLGASFVWGGLTGTLDVLEPAVRPGGHVAVGEPFWRRLPLPDEYEERHLPFTDLEGTVAIVESGGLRVVTVVASSEDDFDRYETLHWRAVETWLEEHADGPDAHVVQRMHERSKRTYIRYGRELLGWAILAGRKPT